MSRSRNSIPTITEGWRQVFVFTLTIIVFFVGSENLYRESNTPFLPSPPINVTLETERLKDSTAVLKWTPDLDGGIVRQFVVIYGPVNGNKTSWAEVFVNTTNKVDEFNTSLTALEEGSRYVVLIFAENEYGNSTIVEISFETPGTSSKLFSVNSIFYPSCTRRGTVYWVALGDITLVPGEIRAHISEGLLITGNMRVCVLLYML